MELKFPDGEEKKKNDVCKPIPIPCYPEDAFLAFRIKDYPYLFQSSKNKYLFSLLLCVEYMYLGF